jgi:phospholipid/cholesterol/gamma-HCH transport system ATP-binding protein
MPTTTQSADLFADYLTSGQPIVEFDNVSIGFEGHAVLTNVSFTVAHGETRIILGPAGCGKSLLMKLANGLLAPDTGEVRVFGRNLSGPTSAWSSRSPPYSTPST